MKYTLLIFLSFASLCYSQNFNKFQYAKSAKELDSLWVNYFENNDFNSLLIIMKTTELELERQDFEKFVVGAAAKYSLIKNLIGEANLKDVMMARYNIMSKNAQLQMDDIISRSVHQGGIENYHKYVRKILKQIVAKNIPLSFNGYGKVKLGMRTDIAYRETGTLIVSDVPLTEEMMKYYYAYIDGKSNELKFLVENIIITCIINRNEHISFNGEIRIGDSLDKLNNVYGSELIIENNTKSTDESYYSVSNGKNKIIFGIKDEIIVSFRVGLNQDVTNSLTDKNF